MLTPAASWVDSETPVQKATHSVRSHLYKISRTGTSTETDRLEVARGWGFGENREYLPIGYGVSFWGDEKYSGIRDGYTIL